MSDFIGLFIVAIVFGCITAWHAIASQESVKKKKIDAALRMEEMERGYAPGTYSDYKKHPSKEGKIKHLHQEMEQEKQRVEQKTVEREQLKQGISDLERRLDNIQTIMDGREQDNEEGRKA